jgi:hypothetical protein
MGHALLVMGYVSLAVAFYILVGWRVTLDERVWMGGIYFIVAAVALTGSSILSWLRRITAFRASDRLSRDELYDRLSNRKSYEGPPSPSKVLREERDGR